ncbi:MAG: SIMPL domain-containing protein [Acidobacteriota bacterium]|nr:SIMPL domain-containing protein [Acidobacteriota bacterium]
MKNNLHLAVLLSLALSLFAIALWFYPQSGRNNLTRATVVGETQTEVAPDTALITFSVVTQNTQAVAAQQENARKSEAVQQSIQTAAGNVRHEVKTSDYSLQPEQDYDGRMPKIVGYTARNTVTIKIEDLKMVGSIIDAATKAGANSVENVSFVVREDSPARSGSLAMAARQAMAKAEAIAASLGGRVVRVVESHESGTQPPTQMQDYGYAGTANTSMVSAKPLPPTPIKAGSLDLRASVVLTVEIEVKR